MKVDSEYDETFALYFTADEVRAFFDTGDTIEELDTALDKAQAHAKIHNEKCYVVIEVKP